MGGRLWTVQEVQTLIEACYLPVLRAQIQGQDVVKAEYLRIAETKLPGRTHHTVKDRCYRISEVLRDEGYPFVRGWNPPDEVGQTPNSVGTTKIIRDAVIPIARKHLQPL